MGNMDTKECFLSHMGIYAIEPLSLRSIVREVVARKAVERPVDGSTSPQVSTQDRIAIIPIHGAITKKRSKFSDNSAVELKALVRSVARDPEIGKIVLHIDSPGGAVEGIDDLAMEVKRAAESKPVIAYCEDLCASAGYWIASQATEIVANRGAFIGSLGVYGVIEDWSEKYEREGVKVHVISTGGNKGAGVRGTEITGEQLKDEQRIVDAISENFQRAVSEGRGFHADHTRALFVGKVWPAHEALTRGLIDRVGTLEEILEDKPMAESEGLDLIELGAATHDAEYLAEEAEFPPMKKKKKKDEEEDDEEMEDEKALEEAANFAALIGDAEELATAARSAGCPLPHAYIRSKLINCVSYNDQLELYGKFASMPSGRTMKATGKTVLGFEDKQPTEQATHAEDFPKMVNAEIRRLTEIYPNKNEQEIKAEAWSNLSKGPMKEQFESARVAFIQKANS